MQSYLDVQGSNNRAAKTMMKYRDVLNRFAAHCRDAGVRLSARAVSMLRTLPRRRRWVIDRMNGTDATATQPANDRHILAYLKAVLG